MNYISTKQLALKLKCSYSPIRKLCAKLKVPKLGRDYMISEDQAQQIAAMLHDGPGNPQFGKVFWDKRPRPKR